jgi:hypothetical protein
MVVWYMIDTGFSIYYGINFNAIFNTFYILLANVPLVLSYKYFKA